MKHNLMLLALCIVTVCCSGQTADEIVGKYFMAIGGKDKVAAMKTMVSRGEMNIMNNPAPFVTYITDGTGYKNDIDFNGQKVITCYSNGAGWTVNPLTGITDPAPVPADQAKIGKTTYDLKGPLYDYAAKGNKLEKIAALELKLTASDGTETHFSFDGSTGYLVKTVSKFNLNGTAFEIVTVQSNYQKTNTGVWLPFTVETTYPGLTVTATAKTIEVNATIDPAIFTMPQK